MTQMATTRARGTLGEDFACACLQKDGYEILERNWRNGHHEIDLIVKRGDVVAFVEVKTRAEGSFATPAESVTKAQRRRIVLAAVAYLKSHGIYNTGAVLPRFDLFEVVTGRTDSPEIVRYAHLPAAYDTGDLDVFL